MKRRLAYLFTCLVITLGLGISLIPLQTASAATTTNGCNPILSNCPGSGGGGSGGGGTACSAIDPNCTLPGTGGGASSVTSVCPTSMSGFPQPSDNPAVSLASTAFYQCEASWARANGKTPPGSGAPNYCERTFIGAYLDSCNKGMNAGGQGNATTVCGSDTACLDGFNIGDDPTENPNAPSAAAGADSPDTSPTCESSSPGLSWFLCPIFNELSNASTWLFQNIVQPFLITSPISTDPSDPSFQVWSQFRVYGDIFLVIALLVIVFGESIGGGLIDAYTAKKVLPRLLVAAVLINLSIYIVAVLVDISNVLGKGVGDILTAPFTHCTSGSGNCWDFNLTGADQARVFSMGLIGFLFSSTAIAGFIGAIIFGSLGTVITMAFFVMLPIFFSILAVFITLILRKGLILMLILISPVAFALYCLPNTERFFKRWWDLLIEALMVYPIIVAIFGVAEILSITILNANGISSGDLQGSTGAGSNFFAGNINRSLALLVAFLLQFLPLLAVPFAFRFAGGALSKIYDAATGAGSKLNELAEGRREHAKRDYAAESNSARARMYHRANEFGEQHKGPLGLGRRASRWAANRAGGYNIEAVQSAARGEYAKQMNDQIATGRDEEIRGLTVNKQQADKGEEGVEWRMKDGIKQYKSLGGAWVNEQDVDAGHRRWGSNQYAQQAALSYEMRKAVTEEDAGRIATNYASVATGPGGWGMSRGEAGGALKGAGFENQNQHVEFKYMDVDGNIDAANQRAMVDEIYNNRGSYNLSQMNSHTLETLKNAHTEAVRTGDTDQQEKITAISETFMHDTRGGGGSVIHAGGEGEQPIVEPATQIVEEPAAAGATGRRSAPAGGGRVVGSQGSAHTAERVFELARQTGVLEQTPGGAYTDPAHSPTPGQRSQSSLPPPPDLSGPGPTPPPPPDPDDNATGRSIP